MNNLARKILMIMLIFSMALFPSVWNYPEVHAMPVLKEAVKWSVKEAIKKETKSAVESQLIKSGVRTTEKAALEKANERWFQRLTSEEVTSLTSAVERATPAGTPGWLKIVVGAGMFATGADLAYDIYDYLDQKKDVPYYTAYSTIYANNAFTEVSPKVKSIGNLTTFVQYDPAPGADFYDPSYYVYFKNGDTIIKSQKRYFNVDLQYSTLALKLSSFPNKLLVELKMPAIHSYLYFNALSPANGYVDSTLHPFFKDYAANLPQAFNDPLKESTYIDEINFDNVDALLSDVSGGYNIDQSIVPETIPMPSSQADIWPGETEAVEIIFPDPDFFPDTTATIIANPQIVTNPIPETQPDPQPSSAPTPSVAPSVEPTGQPNPSAEPTLSPSSTPTPSVVPSSQPTTPPVIGGEDPNPTTPPGEEDDDDYDGPVIDSPLTPEEALANGWEDVTPPLIKEYKDPKTGTVVKFNTKTWEITYNKYFGVDIVNSGGKKLGEIDEIDMENKIFYEDKSAKGLYIIPPGKDKPNQTPQEWADYQIRDKTAVRINSALKDGVATMPTPEGSKIVPDIESFRNFREFIFRMSADTVELREATENALNDLRQAFPDYKFSATFGGGD